MMLYLSRALKAGHGGAEATVTRHVVVVEPLARFGEGRRVIFNRRIVDVVCGRLEQLSLALQDHKRRLDMLMNQRRLRR